MPRTQASLRAYVVQRLLLTGPMVLILLTLVFYFLRAAPGDPVGAILGEHSGPLADSIRRQLGLYDPLYVQYVDYLRRIFTGDMGNSIITQHSVAADIAQRLPATIELTVASMFVAVLAGMLLGVVSATRRDRPADVISRLVAAVLYNTPIFWFGIIMQLVFAVQFRWFDSGGRLSAQFAIPPRVTGLYTIDSLVAGQFRTFIDAVAHLILPALTLGLVLAGFFARLVRANMLQSLQADYVEAARARGIRPLDVFYRHALKNAMVPVSTAMGLTFAILMSGAILTESVFSWEGIGRYIFTAISNRDYPALQGAVVYYALIMVFLSVLIDIFNAWIDPRIRY
ncbi:MAG: ABC transporter permease [Candidatus Eisenbacteria bacterium]|uniref:ABC transporter permease n=1 Tax=Eiseniibacteriota bacterium TaxID=2212470 RepID=A0A538SA40_UNCEI|nr:MAG: ABC transporter permease [Euryarchaeota archaeon]TMQ48251.1 MAG: ABC transporter permease [Candidatus Eisenbacteria bacterium]TMQ51576.1 MAG: ABC transporter permease [Candidatus Eisenbacteria bacterium]